MAICKSRLPKQKQDDDEVVIKREVGSPKFECQHWDSVVVVVMALALHSLTMSKYICGGDAGELAGSACSFSRAHPPGYPLFTWVYGTVLRWSQWTSWSVQVRLGLVSVTFTSIATSLLYNLGRTLELSSSLSLLAAFGFSFSRITWLYASQSEVFALNNFLLTALLRCAAGYYRLGSPQILIVCAFISGLSLSNQHTALLFIVPLGGVALHHCFLRKQLSPMLLVQMTFAGGIGLLPYALLPALNGRYSWGNMETWSGMLNHVLRREYGSFQLAANGSSAEGMNASLRSGLVLYLGHLFQEIGLPIVVLVGVGLWITLSGMRVRSAVDDHEAEDSISKHPDNNKKTKRRRGQAVVGQQREWKREDEFAIDKFIQSMALAFAFYILVFHALANISQDQAIYVGVLARFWQQPDIILWISAALGLSRIQRLVTLQGVTSSRLWEVLIAALLIAHIKKGWVLRRKLSDSNVIHEFGASVATSLPPGGLVLVSGDLYNNVLRYHFQCVDSQESDDIDIINIELMTFGWFVPTQAQFFSSVTFPSRVYHPQKGNGFTMAEFLEHNLHREIILCGGFSPKDESHARRFKMIPFGLCHRIVRRGETESPSILAEYFHLGARSLPNLPPFDFTAFDRESWERAVYIDSWKSLLSMFFSCSIMPETTELDESRRLPANVALLRICAEVAERMVMADEATVSLYRPTSSMYLKAGVVLGTYSLVELPAEIPMVTAFQKYVQMDDHANPDVKNALSVRFNIFRNQPLTPVQ